MNKIIKIFLAALFSFASIFLSLSGTVNAAVGDNINAKITINNGADFIEPNSAYFDNDSGHRIANGGTASFVSTGGNHTISFAMDFLRENQGYTFVSATVNGADAAITAPTHNNNDNDYHITVPEANNYVINLSAERTGAARYTIIWANPDVVDDIQDEDMLIKNGFAKVIAIYDASNHLVDPITYTINPNSENGVFEGYGHIKVEPGMKVVFEFAPVYGYQLTSVSANNLPLAPQETTNQYTFTMPETNVHFSATFTKTDDAVIAGSDKVSGGSIKLGAGELDGGTAQLSVTDADIDAIKIADFDKAAAGYEISNVFDIDFYNVFYKGKADADDVWANQIHELNEEATVTLKLADDVDVSRVVIVHNIDDGDEYEIIKIESYDTEAHTITFKTKSFSNFAIATGVGSPNTGAATRGSSSVTTSAIACILAGAAVAAISSFFAKKAVIWRQK